MRTRPLGPTIVVTLLLAIACGKGGSRTQGVGELDPADAGGSGGASPWVAGPGSGGPSRGNPPVTVPSPPPDVPPSGGELADAGVDAGALDAGLVDAGNLCGNGVLDPGEACDGEVCCSPTCDGPVAAGLVICRESTGECDPAEQCSGASMECPADVSGACGACGDIAAGGVTGATVVSGSTVGEDADFTLSCGTAGAADSVVSFTAPTAGDFRFDTFGSSFDTSLAIFADCTSGSELACAEDVGASLQSEITLSMTAGQEVFVAVSGFGGFEGDWVLNVNAPADLACATVDAGTTTGPGVATGTTVGAEEVLTQTCGQGGVDSVVSFTAPASGDFQFDTVGSTFDTLLAIYSECESGREIACNDDSAAQLGDSELTLTLTAGQQIVIAISGFSGATGDWVLNVTPL